VDRAPETHYAKADDGVHIAYQVFGAGLFDLVVVPGFISHVELGWDDEAIAHALRRLGSFSRVILFDKRGTGMSDRPDQLPDIDRRMLDIEAVMQAAGSEQAAILAVSEGGPMALLFRRYPSGAGEGTGPAQRLCPDDSVSRLSDGSARRPAL
jgi:pimeloyl-ACP methyl ester carboxylesterase